MFQGGGSLSAPQVGMLRAQIQRGITPDLVVGTSAGALNAVASMRTIASALVGRGDGLFDATPLAQLLRTGILAASLEDTEIPAHVVAADLATGQPVILSHGDTQSALLACPPSRGSIRPAS